MKPAFKLGTLVSAALFVLCGCEDSVRDPVHFELPKSYSGPLVLVEEPGAPKVARHTSEEYRIVVPPSGVLHLSDAWMLRRFHKLRASRTGGAPVPTEIQKGFGFYEGLSSTRDNRTHFIWFFVGDYTEARAFFEGTEQQAWLNEHGVP